LIEKKFAFIGAITINIKIYLYFNLMQKISQNLIKKRNFSHCVSCDKYHNIFYSGDITMKNVQSLIRIVQTQNEKYKNIDKIELLENPIKLHITSYGGDLEAGLLAYDLLKMSRFPIYTYANGYAMSAATLPFLVGTQRYMTPNSKILIHQLRSGTSGTYKEIQDSHYNNSLYMNDIRKIYLKETKLTKKKLEELLDKDIYLTASECKRLGFTKN
jgi:ATP-dependent Clp protease, protease subunit